MCNETPSQEDDDVRNRFGVSEKETASLDKGRFALDQEGSRRRVNTETGGTLNFYPPLVRIYDLTVLVHG